MGTLTGAGERFRTDRGGAAVPAAGGEGNFQLGGLANRRFVRAVPYYEFYCPETHTVYTFFARSLRYAGRSPRCPDPAHAKAPMEKRVSRFAVTGRAKEPSEMEGPDPEDPRMERAMAEMEREFAGMDEDHPDPRQLGRMMRRMGDLMGGNWTPEMEEMARRLEGGENPDKLEEQFGDSFEETMAADGGETGPVGAGGASRRLLRRLRPEPRRDPRIYEMKDYVAEPC